MQIEQNMRAEQCCVLVTSAKHHHKSAGIFVLQFTERRIQKYAKESISILQVDAFQVIPDFWFSYLKTVWKALVKYIPHISNGIKVS